MNILGALLHPISAATTIFGRDKSDIGCLRQQGGAGAIIFVHGFTGELQSTWGSFPNILLSEPGLRGWDVFAYGYPTSLRLDVPRIWAADPSLHTIAESLKTRLLHAPFKDYQSLAIIAHSMGGLIAQRAVMDKLIWDRTSDVILFGCPSNGVDRARIVRKTKTQLADLSPGSDFINRLRRDWADLFGERIPFHFLTIAGRMDQFVGTDSSLSPFPEETWRVIAGTHLQIVKPSDVRALSARIVIEAIQGHAAPTGPWNSAIVAGENRRFRRVIELLGSHEDELDEQAAIELALAYDALGQNVRAISVLERVASHGIKFSDPHGVLGGRFKREWLVYRKKRDWEKAFASYSRGLEISRAAKNPGQAMYHCINLAFLELMIVPANEERIPRASRAYAEQALEHTRSAPPDQWTHATIGEALIYLQDISGSIREYGMAIKLASQREIFSMYTQAIATAERIGGKSYVREIMSVFGHQIAGDQSG